MALSKVRADQLDNSEESTDINVVRRNGQTISTDFTIDADQNGMSAGKAFLRAAAAGTKSRLADAGLDGCFSNRCKR